MRAKHWRATWAACVILRGVTQCSVGWNISSERLNAQQWPASLLSIDHSMTSLTVDWLSFISLLFCQPISRFLYDFIMAIMDTVTVTNQSAMHATRGGETEGWTQIWSSAQVRPGGPTKWPKRHMTSALQFRHLSLDILWLGLISAHLLEKSLRTLRAAV